ncbi:MAG TPA: tyrosinase family protein [Anaerolineales bacterium]|nr:tyrosinase family protein [Anaerolineales bacterium]
MASAKRTRKEGKRAPAHGDHDPHHGGQHGHKPHNSPYEDPDYDRPQEYEHEPPDNPRYPDPRIYGEYASKKPPRYLPHPFEHTCFKPRKEDYKPPVTCYDDQDDTLCIRKDHRRLTSDEQSRFLNAFTQVNAMSALAPLVDIHANGIHQMHGNPRFLPWHRIYLLRMEALLMMVDPTVCIPYWKSSEEQTFPSWLLGFTPTVNLMSGPHTVTRNIGMFATLPDAADVAAAMANGTFNSFGGALEGIHNSGHVWVGGSMSGILTAPCDPVFWMHHCEIDRTWAEWQAANPGQDPALAGAAAIMDPWSETEVDTRDITALGYAYA